LLIEYISKVEMNKKKIRMCNFVFTCVAVLMLHHGEINAQANTNKKPVYNVVFIFVDDLRPELGCYGNKNIRSPNIDAIASRGIVFKKHYVVVPTCGASRAAILTGMRPRKSEDLSNDVLEIRRSNSKSYKKASESFVENFRKSGYYTVGIGKISHSPDGRIYKYLEPVSDISELPQSWDEMLLDAGKWGTGWNAFFGYANGNNRNTLKGEVKPYENADVEDEGYPDGLTANLAVKKLKELASRGKPFFLGVGFFKPHLPFNAPKKYWDMYEESKITLTPSPRIPGNVNPESLQQSGEFNGYKLGEEKASLEKPLSDTYARKLRHGYYAGVSYIDAQVGKVTAALKELGLDKNTIIVVWGDHGWHLGDERVWGKHTLSEWALRSPLIIKMPGAQKGSATEKIVSSVDVYPTLMEICGIDMPVITDGKSLVPLINNPSDKTWKNVAYSYFKKGISVRSDNFRLTKFFRNAQPDTELYNYQADPYETKNVANQNPAIVKHLLAEIDKANTGLYKVISNPPTK
jgi:arylsulfatase A-like enzyme